MVNDEYANKSPAPHFYLFNKKKHAALFNTQHTDIQRIEDEKVRRSTVLHSLIQTMCQLHFRAKIIGHTIILCNFNLAKGH